MSTNKFIFTKQALKDLKKLSPDVAKRLNRKIKYFVSLDDPLILAKPLIDLPPATHRFRFGKLRLTFFVENSVYYICSIKYRRNVYV